MPRGKYVNHKGRSRRFTSPEELQQQSDEESSGSEESSSEEEQPGSSGATVKLRIAAPAGKMPTSSEDSDEDPKNAKKGFAPPFEVSNPNRSVQNVIRKLSEVDLEKNKCVQIKFTSGDRKQLDKQKSRERYEKMHAEGKTYQAKADLARLALIRQQRAAAAAKREAELKKKATDEKKVGG